MVAVNGRIQKGRKKKQSHTQPDDSQTEFRQFLEIVPANVVVNSSDVYPTGLSFVPGMHASDIV